ncbi:class II aldolase/adducin family protein [Ponticaulis sp.]|uniref:class II aldolase/adducin family protein n=1 Tax=Ponticaulis sp. TaxID=2020902 RepID=UPI000C4B2660|nr:class II aldolase/adducin family protein [Ponticaulis sp.]MBN04209.1 class II aldolase [Ponticaulis sp.]
MADDLGFGDVKSRVSAEEWQARVDLAALYRLTAYHGWDDLIFTHISMRVPGPEHHFLINPYGLLFEEITASSLVKVDLEGEIVEDTPYNINPAGFTIHSAIHAAREDARCVMHLHTDQGVAVSAQKNGLLPISQHAMIAQHEVAYHDYEGVALNHDERERIVADMGDKSMLILRNHGTLTCGATAAQTYMRMFYLERACKMQIMAQAGGGELIICSEEVQDVVKGQSNPKGMAVLSDKLLWPAALRRLDRNLPGYDA